MSDAVQLSAESPQHNPSQPPVSPETTTPDTSPIAPPLHLPISRGRSYIDLLVRDPDWAWAQWELTAEGVEATLRKLGVFSTHAQLVVRLYNIPRLTDRTQQDISFVDEFEVSEWVGARYLLLGRPDTFHAVAIGLRDPDKTFQAIARSRWLRAPRSRTADAPAEPAFLTVERVIGLDGKARLVPKPVA